MPPSPRLIPRWSRLIGAVLAVAALATVPARVGAAPAPDADPTVQALRRQADEAAQRYFDALAQTRTLDAQIADIEARLPQLEARRRALRASVRERAVAAYERSGQQLSSIISSDDVLTAARRTQWLDRLNTRDDAAFVDLRRVSTSLETRRAALERARAAHRAALDALQAEGRDIDAKLQAAEDRARAAQAAAAAAAAPVPRPVEPKATPSAPPAPPPDYQPTPGVNPHHDDPFLVCTRARESGGNYAAYNPAGPYYGAYQLLQATWNSTANHAGRPELIGVPPNTASEFDQDDIAWDLYQWQGSAPWGGACA